MNHESADAASPIAERLLHLVGVPMAGASFAFDLVEYTKWISAIYLTMMVIKLGFEFWGRWKNGNNGKA